MAVANLAEATPITDEMLIQQVGEGDEAAFEVLYERYFPRVYNFVSRRVRNRADAEETVQEVFINVFSSMHTFRAEGPFAAWVLGLARRVVASRFKKKQHPMLPLEAAELGNVDPLPTAGIRREPSPLEQYECQERLARMEFAARQLTRDQRTVVELHHLNDHSIHDIAQALNKTEDAVKSNLYRARKLLLAP